MNMKGYYAGLNSKLHSNQKALSKIHAKAQNELNKVYTYIHGASQIIRAKCYIFINVLFVNVSEKARIQSFSIDIRLVHKD